MECNRLKNVTTKIEEFAPIWDVKDNIQVGVNFHKKEIIYLNSVNEMYKLRYE